MVAGFWVWWPAFGWLGCYGFLVGTWWVLFCFIYLFIFIVGFWFQWDFVRQRVVVAWWAW